MNAPPTRLHLQDRPKLTPERKKDLIDKIHPDFFFDKRGKDESDELIKILDLSPGLNKFAEEHVKVLKVNREDYMRLAERHRLPDKSRILEEDWPCLPQMYPKTWSERQMVDWDYRYAALKAYDRMRSKGIHIDYITGALTERRRRQTS